MGNHNSGRRPKPTALKLLTGNPGKRKLNAAEPKPPAGVAVRPVNLSPNAAGVWDELAPIAIAMGTLTTADVRSFGRLCELEATAQMASAEKSRENFSPFLYTSIMDSAGNEHQKVEIHPALKIESDTAVKLRPYYEKFGLEPVGRARLSVPQKPDQQSESKWAGVLK